MEWEPQNPDVLWSDFSLITLEERSVHSIDDILREFAKNIEKHQKSVFTYKDKQFIARLYPSKYTKLKLNDINFYSPRSYPDSIRYLFNIKSSFVVISPDASYRIEKDDAHVMSSTVIQAAHLSSFFYPIFINIPQKRFYQYVGVRITGNHIAHFYSKSNWQKGEITDYHSSLNFFKTKLVNTHSILYSSRRFLEINSNFFGKEAVYTYSTFYSVVNRDPINKLRILFQWNKSSPDSVGPQLSDASFLQLSVEYKNESSSDTPLDIFVNKRPVLDGKDEFKNWKSERLNSRIYSFMNNIFQNPKSSSSISIRKNTTTQNFFKSAPEGSLLEHIAIEIAEMKTILNFSMIWCEFLKNVRIYAEKSIPIPGIDDFVDFKYCLIYQNLQVINSLIRNGNKKFCMAENFFEQYIDLYKKAKKESILKMLIVAFKNQNKNATLENFQKVISSSNNIDIKNHKSQDDDSNESDENEEEENDDDIDGDILKTWNSASQENFEFDKKESIEFALDYLEGLKPSEVYLQIVSILFDIAIRDITKRAPIEVPFASTSYESLIKLYNEKRGSIVFNDFKKLCMAIEKTTLQCEIVNSALSKIPSAQFVNQLFEKGFLSINDPKEIQYVTSLLEVMNIDNLLLHTTTNEFIFTGKSQINGKETNRYLFLSNLKQEVPEKYVIALAYQDLL